jgi:DNA-binding response OmpR family regulator
VNILLIEDDQDMSKALSRALERRGFAVTPCFDGASGLRQMRDGEADLVILDLNIPVIDGLHLLQRAREQEIDTPVIVLTARGAVGDRIAGLNAGADDYLAKPFDLNELEARIHALLRRKNGGSDAVLKCADLHYERSSGAFYHNGNALEFTPREQALLKALIARPGHAVTKERLFRLVFALEENAQIDAIEVIIHRLRKKLSATRAEVMTLRGLGYLLRPNEDRRA